MALKAISLWQPFATLMAIGAKRNETRSWPTAFRGELAIHASRRWTKRDILELFKVPYYGAILGMDWSYLPLGAIVGVVNLTGCESTTVNPKVKLMSEAERAFGNYDIERHFWTTEQPRALKSPVRCAGRQGFWNLDAETERKVREQL